MTPQDVAAMMLAAHTANPTEAAEDVLDALTVAGYAVIRKEHYIDMVTKYMAVVS